MHIIHSGTIFQHFPYLLCNAMNLLMVSAALQTKLKSMSRTNRLFHPQAPKILRLESTMTVSYFWITRLTRWTTRASSSGVKTTQSQSTPGELGQKPKRMGTAAHVLRGLYAFTCLNSGNVADCINKWEKCPQWRLALSQVSVILTLAVVEY